MPVSSHLQPPADFADPRLQADFDEAHWPLCNGQAGPAPGVTDLHERRCVELLAAYYEVNRRHALRRAAEAAGAPPEMIKAHLDAVAEALAEVDTLEDRYAAVGFFGEPIMDGVRYGDIRIVRPALPRIFPQPAPVSSHICVPGLEDIPESELQGEPVIVRWQYGKMDL